MTEMKFAPVYHSILKKLKLACRHKPHYVQDIRFILSRPLVTVYSFSGDDSFPPTESQGTSYGFDDQKNSNAHLFSDGTSHMVGGLGASMWSSSKAQSSYLDRPASECWALDPDTLYDVCRADLRAVLDGSREPTPPSHDEANRSAPSTRTAAIADDQSVAVSLPPEGLSAEAAREYLRKKQLAVVPHCEMREGAPSALMNLNPVALKVLRYRELLWLKSRLEKVLEDDTDRRLTEALRVSAPLSEEDFIPDSVLRSSNAGPVKNASTRVLASEDGDNSSSQLSSDMAPKGSASDVHHSPQDETNSTAVISAGAVGIVRECIAFHHKENFPLATVFLADCDRIDASALHAAQYNTSELTRLVCDRITCNCSSQNEDLQLTALVSPFDPEYVNRAHVGRGYFGQAHLIFSVCFRLEPLDRCAYIQIVNSYFTSLYIKTNSMVETTGYLHPRDVMALLQERDLGKFTFQGSLTETEPSDGAMSDDVAFGQESKLASGEKHSQSVTEKAEASVSADATGSFNRSGEGEAVKRKDNAKEFNLTFVNHDEGPVSMKGIFYYKIGTQDTLARAPIKAITFGHLLLNP